MTNKHKVEKIYSEPETQLQPVSETEENPETNGEKLQKLYEKMKYHDAALEKSIQKVQKKRK
jgi:hypothetical protein